MFEIIQISLLTSELELRVFYNERCRQFMYLGCDNNRVIYSVVRLQIFFGDYIYGYLVCMIRYPGYLMFVNMKISC